MPGQTNVLTQHNDIGRTGQNITESVLNTTNVNTGSFGKLYTIPTDGRVFAQPLYISSLSIPGSGTHSVLFVATEHDSVYALDTAAGGTVLWQASLLDSAHGAAAGATTDPASDTACPDGGPEYGITSTPVIDMSTGTIYVVAKTVENAYPVQRLHALDITTGREKFGGPVTIQATAVGTGNGSSNGVLTFDPKYQHQRSGLLLLNGNLYIAWGSHCDLSSWHGWLMSYSASTLVQNSVFITTPNGNGSGIWMAGAGLAADNINGNPRMFLATGNGSFDSSQDWGDDILSFNLLKGLQVADSFTPYNQQALNTGDLDMSSGGVMVLPDQPGANTHLAVILGKPGVLYLLNRDHLGGYNPTADNIVQEVPAVWMWGMPAYWNNNIYVWPAQDRLRQYSLTNGVLSTAPVAVGSEFEYRSAPFAYDGTYFYGTNPSVSANQNQAGSGVVWIVDWIQNPEIVYAHDAGNVANTLWSSAQNPIRDGAGAPQKFAVPTIADGKLFVAGQDQINVYGLLDFSLAASAGTLTLSPDSTTTLTVTLSSTSGFTGGITMIATGLPNGVTASFLQGPGNSAVATFSAATNAVAGTFPITITGTSSNISHSVTMSLTVATGVPFLSSQTPGAVRNNYTGFVGFEFTTGSSAISVSSLGRYIAPQNSGTHLLKLVQASNGTTLPGGSTTITMSGTPGRYQYAPLTSPVILAANSSYFLMSQETAGGDGWFDLGPVAANPAATVIAPAYSDASGKYIPVTGLPGISYVPLNFLYAMPPASTGLAVTISSPATGASLSGTSIPVALSVTGAVAKLQVQVDGMNVGVPGSLILNTTGLSNGQHVLTVLASDLLGDTATSLGVPFTTLNASPVNTTTNSALVTAQVPGLLRNNYSGFVGMSFTTGASPVVVDALGRFAAPGNSGTHLLKLAGASGIDVPGTSVYVSMAGATSEQYKYASFLSPVTLSANTTYYLVSNESQFGDEWFDIGGVTTSAVANVNGPAYQDSSGNFQAVNGLASQSYVPVNFLYQTLSAVITSPQNGSTLSGASVPVSITSTGNVSSAQLQVDGANVGSPVLSNALSFNAVSLPNGQHTLAVIVSDGQNTAVTALITVTVNNGPGTPTIFVTPGTLNPLRNNYTGFVGMAINVGSTPLTVTSLGRLFSTGNSGKHIVKLVQANGVDLAGGSTTISFASGGVAGQFAYSSLATPVILSANTKYYLVSQETSGGDLWHDLSPVTPTSAAQIPGAIYTDTQGNYITVTSLPSYSYVPLSLLYK